MAKAINLVSSRIKSVSVERNLDGTITIAIVGVSVDFLGIESPVKNLVLDWEDLDVQDQNTGDNFLKHLSRSFNNFVADEDSETWD